MGITRLRSLQDAEAGPWPLFHRHGPNRYGRHPHCGRFLRLCRLPIVLDFLLPKLGLAILVLILGLNWSSHPEWRLYVGGGKGRYYWVSPCCLGTRLPLIY